mmetsp:Transcript_23476/g.35643  ORF Transcript_23476/g.35643 Transcript_23476/m.35643 type:complete len:85 (-) Transcript_23476:2140-2394(-)
MPGPATECVHRTEEWISSCTQANDFPTYAIFLLRKFQRAKSGGGQLVLGRLQMIDPCRVDEQLHVAKTKQSAVGGCTGVFTGSV